MYSVLTPLLFSLGLDRLLKVVTTPAPDDVIPTCRYKAAIVPVGTVVCEICTIYMMHVSIPDGVILYDILTVS